MKTELLKLIVSIGKRSDLLKKIGNKLVIYILPKEVETKIGNSRFIFRPRIDGLWYLNYSDAEPGVEKVIRENLNKGDTFVDIGAYIGYYSILACTIVGVSGRIISFEPNPESYVMLKKNIKLNGYQNCIPENIAISDQEGYFKLLIGKYDHGGSSLFPVKEVYRSWYVAVRAIKFDQYCKTYKLIPNFIKIDAEGAEYKIIKSMEKTIFACKPKLMIEIHPRHLHMQGISLSSFFNVLRNQGYKIQLVGEESVKSLPVEKLVNLCKIGRKNNYGSVINQIVFCE